jgi:hypothetical protein
MLDETVFYPAPQSTQQLDMATLNQIAVALDEAFRRELQTVVRVVNKPRPNVLRLRPAADGAQGRQVSDAGCQGASRHVCNDERRPVAGRPGVAADACLKAMRPGQDGAGSNLT